MRAVATGAESACPERREQAAGLVGRVRGQLDDGIVQPLSRTGGDDPGELAGVLLQEDLYGTR